MNTPPTVMDIRDAAFAGDLAAVHHALTLDPSQEHCSEALIKAATRNHLAIALDLLTVADPKFRNSWALCRAAQGGHLEMVNLLLPLSDAKASSSQALRYALEEGHTEVARVLAPVSEIHAAVNLLLDNKKWAALDNASEFVSDHTRWVWLSYHRDQLPLTAARANSNDRQEQLERVPPPAHPRARLRG